ncbi:hypothetical protein JXJ21_12555 [candidate division KSB1 bacterium]|nr:hypothetical protein [candidate division KSB1 bacterium]
MKKVTISQVDTIFVNGRYPIEFLIYFKNKLKSKSIRAALKKLSSDFYPLFGEYREGVIQFLKYSECEHFDEIAAEQLFNPEDAPESIFDRYRTAIPPEKNKLFFLKIIQHKNGTVLIPKLNHLAGDGYSYFYFLSALAALSRITHIPFKKNLIQTLYTPHHNRTAVKEFQFTAIDAEPPQNPQQPVIKFEEIPKSVIRKKIRDVASANAQKVSTNDILSAMVIQKLITIQKHDCKDGFQLTIPIDVRQYIPEYGAKFLGNGIMLHTVSFASDELQNPGIHELAARIRVSMPASTKERFIAFLNHLETIIKQRRFHELRPFNPETGCLVTNLSRLPADKLNFGTGDPDFIFPLTIEKNSAAILSNKNNYILRLAYSA